MAETEDEGEQCPWERLEQVRLTVPAVAPVPPRRRHLVDSRPTARLFAGITLLP